MLEGFVIGYAKMELDEKKPGESDEQASKRWWDYYRSRENSLMTIKAGNKSTIIEDIEMIKMTGSVNDLTIMFKEDKFSFYNMKLKKYNKIRIINFIFFSVLALVMYSLIPLSFKDKC